ncbi:OsmC family peroxiredoxin [Sinimarinibacterium sp. CAU 1509]|uniref:OsmC family protein n=1 Tax=Sinimarinibacterium sp. CAU 1509 TaxID=2562283 RepID=UPI0010AC4249|nr:OsmC family protein [Sinimarinibacterium sp. CAU 1509]TJY63114.1 OsmC family peroxiredoxin [Sinimarinibacterium sp. CAU 1509]
MSAEHQYRASVVWQGADAASFTDNSYSRKHHWHFDGGVTVPASSAPAVVPLPMSAADAVDPEEAFVASLSSCHMLFFLAYAAKKGYIVATYRDDAVGTMGRNDEGRIAMLEVILRPTIEWSGDNRPDAEAIAGLHDRAHHACYIANSVKTIVRIEAA